MEDIQKKPKSCFKNRNFILLLQGSLTSNIAASLYTFALSVFILDISNNNASIQGIYLFVCGLTFVLASIAGGVLADRWDKVKIIYGTDAIKGIMIVLASIPLTIALNTNNTSLLLIIVFTIGIINNMLAALFSPASTAIVPELVEEETLEQANSISSMANSLVAIIGSFLGGVLYSLIGVKVLFIVIGVCYVLSAISELFIKAERKEKAEKLTFVSFFKDLGIGFKYLVTIKSVLYLTLGVLFLNFFIAPMGDNILPYVIKTDITNGEYLYKDILKPDIWLAILNSAFAIGAVVGGAILAAKAGNGNYGKKIIGGLIGMSLNMMLVTIMYLVFIKTNLNIYLISTFVLFVLVGILVCVVNIPCVTVMQLKTEPEVRAKVWSLVNIGTQGLVPFATLLAGFVIDLEGVSAMYIVCTLGFILITILMASSKTIKEL